MAAPAPTGFAPPKTCTLDEAKGARRRRRRRRRGGAGGRSGGAAALARADGSPSHARARTHTHTLHLRSHAPLRRTARLRAVILTDVNAVLAQNKAMLDGIKVQAGQDGE